MEVAFDVEARLGGLPESLEETYIEIYRRISSQPGSSPKLAESALMWVMCSCRPLSPNELVAMISLGSTTASDLSAGSLFKLCHNLLTLDHQLNIVRFAHLSVREFLEKNQFGTVDAHSMASKFCLSYLVNSGNWMTISTPHHNMPTYEYSTAKYTVIFWPVHIQQCLDQQEDPELPELLIKFLKISTVVWYQTLRIFRGPYCEEGPTKEFNELEFEPLVPLQVATVFGFREKIKSLWESESWDVNARNTSSNTTLSIASRRRDFWTVTTLLEKGADVNAQGGHYGNALEAAASIAGNERVVELLLERGADVNAQGGPYGNALQAAACGAGDERVVELLLERGADMVRKRQLERSSGPFPYSVPVDELKCRECNEPCSIWAGLS